MALTSLVEKFEELTVEPTIQLSQEEIDYCKDLENKYNEFKTFYHKYHVFLNQHAIETELFSSDRLLNGMEHVLEQTKNRFVEQIADYFNQRYNISIDYEELKERYGVDVTSEAVIKDIQTQFGGVSFSEKAEYDMKTRLNRRLLRKEYLELRGNRITVQHFLMFHEFKEGYALIKNGGDSLGDLFSALTHYQFGETRLHQELKNIQEELYRPAPANVRFTKVDINDLTDYLLALRFYKNGRVDVYFADEDHADRFYKDYCNA